MEQQIQSAPAKTGKMGCIFVAVVIIFAFFAGNEIFEFYLGNCNETNIIDCLINSADEPKLEGTVEATGVYTYKDYSVTVTANIPLKGGAVTGTVSGTCGGALKGNFDGQNKGSFTGTLTGSCSPFFFSVPASATFNGIVNKDAKNAPISFIGNGAGITHNGAMSLSY